MNSAEQILPEIRESYNESRLIPFIGAGFSIPLGLPDWSSLVSIIANKVGYEPELFFLHGNYQQLLEYIKIYHEPEWREFIHTIRVMFDSTETENNRKKSKTHQALANLNLKTIYTTNYDRHIEKALEDEGKRVLALATLADFVRPFTPPIDCKVIKFHGTILDDESMILTETQYFDRMALEEAVDQRLRSDVLNKNFLFMGYSFNDPNIRYIWYKIHKLKSKQRTYEGNFSLRSSYYVTFGNEPIQSKLLAKWNIKVITLDPENTSDSLSEFLNSIK